MVFWSFSPEIQIVSARLSILWITLYGRRWLLDGIGGNEMKIEISDETIERIERIKQDDETIEDVINRACIWMKEQLIDE